MSAGYVVLLLVAAQRGGELVLAASNTARLRGQGAIEIDHAGYKWFVALHALWLVALALVASAAPAPSWPLLVLFFLLQLARLWVIACLGRRWTTRLIVLPGAPRVASGPYRWLRHPNYLIVIAEIAVLPLAFGAVAIAAVFSAVNLVLIIRRIRIEERAWSSAPPSGATAAATALAPPREASEVAR